MRSRSVSGRGSAAVSWTLPPRQLPPAVVCGCTAAAVAQLILALAGWLGRKYHNLLPHQACGGCQKVLPTCLPTTLARAALPVAHARPPACVHSPSGGRGCPQSQHPVPPTQRRQQAGRVTRVSASATCSRRAPGWLYSRTTPRSRCRATSRGPPSWGQTCTSWGVTTVSSQGGGA